jgi:hypothetical protein
MKFFISIFIIAQAFLLSPGKASADTPVQLHCMPLPGANQRYAVSLSFIVLDDQTWTRALIHSQLIGRRYRSRTVWLNMTQQNEVSAQFRHAPNLVVDVDKVSGIAEVRNNTQLLYRCR